MAIELNQNVSAVILIGPCVDPVSALPVSTLTLAAADSKNWQPFSNGEAYNLSGYTLSQATSGFYHLHVSAGTVSILGPGQLQLTDNSLILPYAKDFIVVTSQYWNAKYGTTPVRANVVSFAANALSAPAIQDGAFSAVKFGENFYTSMASMILSMPLAGFTNAGGAGANLLSTMNLVSAQAPFNATSIWNEATRTLTANTNLNDPALASIVSGIWSAALSDYTTAGTAGANALSTMNMTSSVLLDTGTDGVVIAAGAIDTTQFAAGAIDAAALAADAGTEIANAVWAKVLESQGSITAQQAMQVILAANVGATISGTSGYQFYTPNSGALRFSVASINANNERSAITLNV